MVLKCPACAQTFMVADDVTSGKANCPQCGQRLDLGRILRPGDLPPGTVLGSCRIEGLLGRGGMAVVYKATQISLERPVALKVLPTRLARNPQFVERFNREASALARLTHPNVVGILDKGSEGDTYFFVMEYVEGKSLRDRLLREEKFSPQETRQLLRGICAGLAYAHDNGVVHRDLKPGNILLDAVGTPKLADFGIARMTGADTQAGYELTKAHTVMGSADYMAPEQRADAANVDHRADIYSLGVMLYQMLTGQLPVGSFKPVAHQVAGVPTAVDRVVRAALAASPDERYDSVPKFLFALEHAFDDTSLRHAPRAAHHPARRASMPPALIVLTAVLALAALGGILALALSPGRTRRPPPPPPPDNSHKSVRTSTRVTTGPLVRPKPPEPEPKKFPPPPPEEPPFVREALASVREQMARNPDDFPGHVQRLKDLLVTHGNPQVQAAARKEMAALNERLEKALALHFADARRRADALMDQRAYIAAIRLAGTLPPNLFTSDAKKQAEALAQQYHGKCWTAFERDRKAAAALAEAGKTEEAVAILKTPYPSNELQKLADEELAKLKAALAAHQERVRQEQLKLRADLAQRLKALWADRAYADGPPLAKAAIAKAPDEPSRQALGLHLRAASLLDAFRNTLIEALTARKGQAVTVSNVKYTLKAVEDDAIVLGLPVGGAEVRREFRKLDAADLFALVRDWLDLSKKADDNLMAGMFHAYDATPDPAAAARHFDKALSLGASPDLVAALRNFNGASSPTDVKEPDPKEKEPDPAAGGYALELNGISDYVEVPDDRRGKRPLCLIKAFTIEAWVWRRPGPGEALTRYVLAKNAGWTTSLSYALYVEDGCWAYATGDGTQVDPVVTRVPCPTGTWTHCALVYEDGVRTLFVDGKQVGRSRAKFRLAFDDQPLYIGAVALDGNPARFWAGGIDALRLTNGVRYRKDFTPEREPKPDAATHLLLHADDPKATRVKDASRFETHGTLRGAAAFLPIADFKVRRPGPPLPLPKGEPPKQPPPDPAVPKGPTPKPE
ncbi:MAG: hypothetical protein FJ290_10015, partial [Planctomycetes bacterium]|nr:hypothetical protein [Planctomycetota bacterium]